LTKPRRIFIVDTVKSVIQKWGNSLAVRLPKALADDFALAENVEVDLLPSEQGIVLRPPRKPRYRLSKLVAGISRRNVHSETDWGSSVGREKLE
jgi:antitoxin MazE